MLSEEDDPLEERHDVNAIRPTSLSHIIGQQNAVAQADIAIEAAHRDGTKMDHALLLGPAGCGKTTFANVIACEMASNCFQVIGQAIGSRGGLNALLLKAKDKDIIHIDEAHELSKRLQTGLYTAIDQRRIIVDWGAGPQGIPVADCTILLSTTDEYALLKPLRDRMRLVLRFGFYSVDELCRLLLFRTRSLHWVVDDDVILGVAKRSQGTPRLALRLLNACRLYSRANDDTRINIVHFQAACALDGIDELGLGIPERQYLERLLAGDSRLNVIASALGINEYTVSKVIEPVLIRFGLIAKDGRSGRQLTPAGREHLSHCCRIGV